MHKLQSHLLEYLKYLGLNTASFQMKRGNRKDESLESMNQWRKKWGGMKAATWCLSNTLDEIFQPGMISFLQSLISYHVYHILISDKKYDTVEEAALSIFSPAVISQPWAKLFALVGNCQIRDKNDKEWINSDSCKDKVLNRSHKASGQKCLFRRGEFVLVLFWWSGTDATLRSLHFTYITHL